MSDVATINWYNNIITPVTWNPLDKGSSIALSDDDLTVILFAGIGSVRSTVSKSSGKWYYEIVTNYSALPDNITLTGIETISADINSFVGADANGYGYDSNTGFFKNTNATIGGTGITIAVGDIVGVALDLTGGSETLTIYKNNSSVGSITIPAGTYFAATGSGISFTTVISTTAFLQSSFIYSPPAGYTAW